MAGEGPSNRLDDDLRDAHHKIIELCDKMNKQGHLTPAETNVLLNHLGFAVANLIGERDDLDS